WSRVLNGNPRDEVVGQHVLLGLLVGVGVALVINASIAARFGTIVHWPLLVTSNLSAAAYAILGDILSAASEPPWLFCLLFVLITVTRRRWIGLLLTSIIITTVMVGGDFRLFTIVPFVVIIAFLMFVLRYGLLAMVVAWYAQSIGREFPLTLDSSAFYFGISA